VRLDEDTGVSFSRGGRGLQPEDALRRMLDRAGSLPILLADWAVSRWVLFLCLVSVLIAVPFALTSYWSTVLGFGLIYSLVALSVVVLTGWTGQLSLAPFAFLGVGAFGCAFFSRGMVPIVHGHLPFWLVVPLCGLLTIPAALIIGAPALRLRGFFLALATLAFGAAASNWLFPIVQGKHKDHVLLPHFFQGTTKPQFALAAGVTVLVFLAVGNLQRSRVARSFFALRDSESTAVSFGINPATSKLLAFATSGLIAGLAGGLLGYFSPTVQPNQFDFTFSLQWIVATVVASVIAIPGAILAAFLFSVAPQLYATTSTGVNQAPLILGAIGGIRTVTDYPNGLAMFFKRLLRPFDSGERVAWASADTTGTAALTKQARADEEVEEELFSLAAASAEVRS
jgi:branched-chain amino acid transport system permease protein